jgi:hypothetical protein
MVKVEAMATTMEVDPDIKSLEFKRRRTKLVTTIPQRILVALPQEAMEKFHLTIMRKWNIHLEILQKSLHRQYFQYRQFC